MNLLFWFVAIFIATSSAQNPLTTHFQWRLMDFVFPSIAEREKAIRENNYYYQNCTPIDVDVHYGASGVPKVFVTFPRLAGNGIPITLGTVSQTSSSNGLLINPYPSYDWHKSHGNGNCDEMTSVFRVNVDQCDRLWVLDTGRIASNRICPPQLLVFDLKTDRIYHRYRFPRNQYVDATLLVTPVVNVLDPPPAGNCMNVRVYMADTGDSSLFVYDSKQDRSWRIKHSTFRPTQGFSTFTIEGNSFEFTGGTFGLAFQRTRNIVNPIDNRMLYYHAFSSPFENMVPLNVINNGAAFSANENANPNAFRQIGRRQAQSAAQAMDSRGILYFGLMTPSAIVAWDSSTPYTNENMRLIARDREQLQFSSGVKVVVNPRGQEELWVLTNKFQHRFAARYNWNQINFRILGRPINEFSNQPLNFNPVSGGIPNPISNPIPNSIPNPIQTPFAPNPTNFFPHFFGPQQALNLFNHSYNSVLSQLNSNFPSPFPNFK